MADTSLFYWNEAFGKQQHRPLIFKYAITGALTVSEVNPPYAVLFTNAAIASQSVIDTFLGTTNEFLVAAFDATAMGVDSVGFIVNMRGQAGKLVTAKAYIAAGANGATVAASEVVAVSALTASSLTSQAALGSSGNLAGRFIVSGYDAATTGVLTVEFDWISK